jgi:hypothetical protein
MLSMRLIPDLSGIKSHVSFLTSAEYSSSIAFLHYGLPNASFKFSGSETGAADDSCSAVVGFLIVVEPTNVFDFFAYLMVPSVNSLTLMMLSCNLVFMGCWVTGAGTDSGIGTESEAGT